MPTKQHQLHTTSYQNQMSPLGPAPHHTAPRSDVTNQLLDMDTMGILISFISIASPKPGRHSRSGTADLYMHTSRSSFIEICNS